MTKIIDADVMERARALVREGLEHGTLDGWTSIIASTIQQYGDNRAAAANREGHNEPCYYCGEPCNDFAGNPGLWSVCLSHEDDPGVAKYHHADCVTDRLRTAIAAREAAIEEAAHAALDNPALCGWDLAFMIRALITKSTQ